MSEITEAIDAKQIEITQLQSEIEALQRAATLLGEQSPATTTPRQPKTKQKRKGTTWSAADKKAISRRMKAYWAKRKRAGR